MSDLSRRSFLGGLGVTSLSGFGIAVSPTKAEAQNSTFRFVPDAQVRVAGKDIGIDIALLGANGEETAGFYASLDPSHGTAFDRAWLIFYGPWLMDDPQNFKAWDPRPLTDREARNTSDEKIDNIITHIKGHGLSFEHDLKPIYDLAYAAWQKRSDLRLNGPAL